MWVDTPTSSVCLTLCPHPSLCVSSVSLSHTHPLIPTSSQTRPPRFLHCSPTLLQSRSVSQWGQRHRRFPHYVPLGLEFFLKQSHVLFCAVLTCQGLSCSSPFEQKISVLLSLEFQHHPHPSLRKNKQCEHADRAEPDLRVSFSSSGNFLFIR